MVSPPEALTSSPSSLEARLLAAFDGRIRPVRPSTLYLLGVIVVAAAMVLLVALYLGLLAAVVYGIVHYAGRIGPEWPLMSTGEASLVLLAGYLAPPAAGTLLLFFLVKPLLARRGGGSESHLLHPYKEPLLFAYLERLCLLVGARFPREVRADCRVNASASLRHGLLGFLRRDLVLTIGLPLAAGMDFRQFTGVLAHELGHFTQGTAMRFNELVLGINAWLARLVYERDAWDEQLQRYVAEGRHWWIRIICLAAAAAVWLTRWFYWILMIVGQAISCALTRQMEYNADLHEVRVVGTRTFERTADRLCQLAVGSEMAHRELGEHYKDRMLADDLVSLIVARADQVSAEELAEHKAQSRRQPARLFDTHPTDRSRQENIAGEPEDGVSALDSPATALFTELPHLARTATLLYYEHVLGPEVYRAKLIPSQQLLGRQAALDHQKQAVATYFQGAISLARPLVISRDALRGRLDVEATVAQLLRARNRIEEAIPAARRVYHQYADQEELLMSARQALSLLAAELSFYPRDFHLPRATRKAAEQLENSALQTMARLGTRLKTYESAVQKRLTCGLRLLQDSGLTARIRAAEPAPPVSTVLERDALVSALNALCDAYSVATELRRDFTVLNMLLSQRESAGVQQAGLQERIRRQMSRLHRHLMALRDELRHAPYPFEHAAGRTSLADYAIGKVPPEENWHGLYDAAHAGLDRFFTAYLRVLGQLAEIAERVETALGLPPLKTDDLP